MVDDLFNELINRNVEVRIIDNLWDLCEKIIKTSFNWSMQDGFCTEEMLVFHPICMNVKKLGTD